MSETQKERSRPRSQRNPEPVRDYIKTVGSKPAPVGPVAPGDPRFNEWIEHCKRAARDFTYFSEFMCGVRVHPGQVAVVNAMKEDDYGVLAAANGWGKTFLYALLVMWATFSKQWAPVGWGRYRAVVLGPQMQQSLITHAEVESLRSNNHEAQTWCDHPAPCPNGLECPGRKFHPFRLGPWLIPFKTEATHLAFRWKHNGAIINFESGENKAANIEGWRVNLIVYDEARLELHLAHIMDQVFLARGTRTPNQKIVLGSTPLADSYALLDYYRKGESGKPNWWSHLGSIHENIFLFPAQVQKVRDALDPRIVDQVLAGKWVEPPDAFFIRERVLECFLPGTEAPADIGDYKGKFHRNKQYVGGLDVAVSEAGDESVFTLWDITEVPYRVVIQKVFPKGTPLGTVVAWCDIIIQESSATIGFDASGPLGNELDHQVSYDPASYIPIKFTGGNQRASSQVKVQALNNFRHFINNKLWECPYLPDLQKEIVSYNIAKDQNQKKDRLMAQVYAAWVAKDYLNFSGGAIDVKSIERSSYEGAGVSYRSADPPDWAQKTGIQRQWLRMVEKHTQREEMLKALSPDD